ncbi:MAG TPA: bifunctional protein-serine/threonine kinase/phosphatase [Methylophilaceae bacterium]|jgi:protein phosphatase|nr:bifunctional protein-serine/threonine kinase/phosphatase [Methylophilaceae bacterium]
MSLKLTIGESSIIGPRERNEDYVGLVLPTDAQLATKGALLAVADGIGGNAGGREAAEMTVRTVCADYFATPDTWETHASLDTVITAANRWVLSQAAINSDLAGMATTLSLLILKGQHFVIAHVGDTRVYRLRNNELKQLTSDHVWDRPDMRHVLKRAVGLDQHLPIDYVDGQLEVGDVFAIVSDGVWGPLNKKDIRTALMQDSTPQMIGDHLTEKALAKGGLDNSTALIARVDALGADSLTDSLSNSLHLTVPTKLKIGEKIDEFEVLEILHDSRTNILYKVKSTTGQLFVLKTLQQQLANDVDSCKALMNEEWLAKRVVTECMPQILPLNIEQRNFLYYVMTWHEGATLQERLDNGHHFTVNSVAKIGADLLRGLSMLHRLNILHRDIKPDNIHIGLDQQLRILDLGVALNPTTAATLDTMENPGTPSYMAPELFGNEGADIATDIYAAGVTLYYLLTRKYPYGEIEPFQKPRFGDPIRPTRYRPEIPSWLENIILKAIARDINKRFETPEEMLLALEYGEFKPIAIRRTPLIERARLQKWQWVTLFSMIFNFLLIYLLVVS